MVFREAARALHVVPHPRCGVVRFQTHLFSSPGSLLLTWNSSPRPVYSSLIPRVPNPKVSLECPTLQCPWSAQPERLPGVPNRRVSRSAQTLPGVPKLECSRRVSRECPNADCPRSAQPQSLYKERVGMFEVNYCFLFFFVFVHCVPVLLDDATCLFCCLFAFLCSYLFVCSHS